MPSLRTTPLALVAILLAATPAAAQSTFAWSNFAGQPGRSGSADGTGGDARFAYPGNVIVDGAGNLLVTDALNYTIRRVTPAGVVTTLAGRTGVSGATDGPLGVATFGGPSGLALDAAGNLYVSDGANYTIRRVAPDGTVSTVAGQTRVMGDEDGTGAGARFRSPGALAVEPSGNVLVTDSQNCTIRRVTPGGVVTTLAGRAFAAGYVDGVGAAARFAYPSGIALDEAGNAYVVDSGNSVIRRVAPDGTTTTVAGNGESAEVDGPAAQASFVAPGGLARDSTGNLFVTEGLQTIRQITAAGVVSTVGGFYGAPGARDGAGANARFNDPRGIAVSAAGSLYVVDGNNYRIARGVPTPVVPARLANVSTRLRTSAGDDVLIAGFVIRGGARKVVVRALGPSLVAAGVTGLLADPSLAVFDAAGNQVAANNDWQGASAASEVQAAGLAPSNARESALSLLLPEGTYTAIVRGAAGETGNCLAEVYEIESSGAPKLINLSTRGPVGTGDSVMIAGFIVQGTEPRRLLVRALGPSLASVRVANPLANPTLELYSTTTRLSTNDDWAATQRAEIAATGLAPSNPAESAILVTLPPGAYTAIVRGQGGATGNALVEVYELP